MITWTDNAWVKRKQVEKNGKVHTLIELSASSLDGSFNLTGGFKWIVTKSKMSRYADNLIKRNNGYGLQTSNSISQSTLPSKL